MLNRSMVITGQLDEEESLVRKPAREIVRQLSSYRKHPVPDGPEPSKRRWREPENRARFEIE